MSATVDHESRLRTFTSSLATGYELVAKFESMSAPVIVVLDLDQLPPAPVSGFNSDRCPMQSADKPVWNKGRERQLTRITDRGITQATGRLHILCGLAASSGFQSVASLLFISVVSPVLRDTSEWLSCLLMAHHLRSNSLPPPSNSPALTSCRTVYTITSQFTCPAPSDRTSSTTITP